MRKLCYMEDCDGGFICRSEDKEHFLALESKPVICIEGTKEELEEFTKMSIHEHNIFTRMKIPEHELFVVGRNK